MADLQYYGVSQYELSDHPDLSLGAIRQFLEQLDFNVELDQVRIHARCDKERVLDLGKLIERISMLFHLIPYLMDLDWVIGSLTLGKDAKQKIAAAWAKSFLGLGIAADPHACLRRIGWGFLHPSKPKQEQHRKLYGMAEGIIPTVTCQNFLHA